MNSIGHQLSSPLNLELMERLQSPTAAPSEQGPDTFVDYLSAGLTQVNEMQLGADAQVHELLSGGDVSRVEVLTSVQKADMAFRLLVQIRNKLMTAYDEINAIRI